MKSGVIPSLDNLPPEILKEIASYLSPTEWAQLKCVSSHFNSLLNSPIFQGFWDIFLFRLQTLSPFSLNSLDINAKKEALFRKSFYYINLIQQREINHFIQFQYSENHHLSLSNVLSDFMSEKMYSALEKTNIKEINQAAETLSQLEERHVFLNEINNALIHDHLNIKEGTLVINWIYITRIPVSFREVVALFVVSQADKNPYTIQKIFVRDKTFNPLKKLQQLSYFA